MNKRFFLFLVLFLFGASACTPPNIDLELASQNERIPFPNFVARDLLRQNAWPEFSQITVYESIDNCAVPNCPVMWKVIVSEGKSPREITYGELPSFGAQTIIAPKDLIPGSNYQLILDQAEGTPPTGKGALSFSIDENGVLKSAAVKASNTDSSEAAK